jgi:pimeloyl-ACP methyl ester carboxylesterase
MASSAPAVVLPDGRELEYLTGGDPDGFPFVYHFGTPSGAVHYQPLWDAAERAGLHLVTYSRPGYGASTPRPVTGAWPPPISADAEDTVHLLDHLGMGEFVTLGWSGGGPRALACAAVLPDRCRAVASLAGVAPYGLPGLDWTAGMGPENVRDFEAAVAGREAYAAIAAEQVPELAAVTGPDMVAAFGGLIDEVDAAALTGEFADYAAATFRHSVAQGSVGMVEDTLQIVRPWGFDLADLTVPVAVWQGAHDKMVPFTHGEWLAQAVPGARVHLYDDEGHLSLVAKVDEILADLRGLAGL